MKYLFRAFLVISFFVSELDVNASHIVGGEFEVFKSPRGNSYDIYMNQYFDRYSASQGTLELDQQIIIGVYEKGTNTLVATTMLTLRSTDFLQNASGGCVDSDEQQFRNKFYYGQFFPVGLNSPNGYYISWEQCCRNSTIVNIQYADADREEPIVFYAELPPFNISNNTPNFPVMKTRNLCRNQLNTFDFSGIDPDGDSLVYDLITPVASSTSNINGSYPNGGTYFGAPYNFITWAPGYSSTAQITGNKNLTIDRHTGVMSVNPSTNGLFVFAVLVKEFRNGVRIGAVKREYQIKVIDCPINNAPKVTFQNNSIVNGDTIEIRLKSAPAQCYGLEITDPDALLFGRTEYINIQSKINRIYSSLLTIPTSTNVSPSNPVSTLNVCFNPCAVFSDGLERYVPISIVVNDFSCPAKYDTLQFVLHLLPSSNHKPVIEIEPSGNPKILKVDSVMKFIVKATDADPNDRLSLYINGAINRAFYFQNVKDSFSTISSPFLYRPTCKELENGSFTVYFIVNDGNCDVNKADTIFQAINIVDNPDVLRNVPVTNLVTPNGDGNNDVFYIPNMPPDNCTSYFKTFTIYNRWGALIYKTGKRDFVWDPKDLSEGVYYYQLDLNSTIQKGWIQVIGY